MRDARCWVSSGVGGALVCVDLAGDIDRSLAALGVKGVEIGQVRRRSVPVGVGTTDEAVVARWTVDRATVMTHGGRAVVDGLLGVCVNAGLQICANPVDTFVESADEIEGLMLATLAKAQSPAAIDLLLDQPRRWRSCTSRSLNLLPSSPREAALCRLIEPALVVAVGPPNIGKSSLLNALAGRGVSVVADQPGTTRDHVGALIDLGGVVVRWVDTPGLAEHVSGVSGESGSDEVQIQQEAQKLARQVAAQADVLVVCADASGAIEPPETAGKVVRVGLRADLGTVAVEGVDASVSVKTGVGLERLVELVREAVVPSQWLDDGEPWRFW